MKKALHTLASLLCLLTILLSTATCVHAERPSQSSCSQCPKRAPLSHSLPSCCAAQPQPPAVPSARIERPAQSITLAVPLSIGETAPFYSSQVTQQTVPLHSPPRIALRI